MDTYKTAEIAAIVGVHPNTIRLYEELELIPKPERLPNGYRVFTELHVQQFRLARTAFQIEVIQNGLRKKIVRMVKASALGDYDAALALTGEYLAQVRQERANAEEAVRLVEQILSGGPGDDGRRLRRKEVSQSLGISMDTLRNWEMNGLLQVKRKQNGYRVYSAADLDRLAIIRALRAADYSLAAILRLLDGLDSDATPDIGHVLDHPYPEEDILAVCDGLAMAVDAAERNAFEMIELLERMKKLA